MATPSADERNPRNGATVPWSVAAPQDHRAGIASSLDEVWPAAITAALDLVDTVDVGDAVRVTVVDEQLTLFPTWTDDDPPAVDRAATSDAWWTYYQEIVSPEARSTRRS